MLYSERRALIGSFILLVCAMCISGELMHLAEGQLQPASFGTLPDSIYWAIATLATVGYGDHVPITMLGRLIAGLTMVTGLVLFAMPIGIVATGFVNGLHRREFAITWSMVKRQPLFAGLEVGAITEVVDLMGANLTPEHSRIVRRGDRAERMFLIVGGRALAEDDQSAWDLEPGDVFGVEALDDGGRYRWTITARTEMRLMVLAGDDLRRLARKYPVLEERVRESG